MLFVRRPSLSVIVCDQGGLRRSLTSSDVSCPRKQLEGAGERRGAVAREEDGDVGEKQGSSERSRKGQGGDARNGVVAVVVVVVVIVVAARASVKVMARSRGLTLVLTRVPSSMCVRAY